MAEFSPFIITSAGQALMAKLMTNDATCNFTKIKVSSTVYTEDQLEALTALNDIKQTTDVSSIEIVDNASVHIKGAVNNTDLTTGYAVNTIGLYALDPDVDEILYAVARATTAGYMPSYNGTTSSGIMFDFMITVGNSDNVSITVNPAAVATQEDIEEIYVNIGDFKKYAGYTADDIYGVEVDYSTGAVTRLAGAFGKHPGTEFDGVECFNRYRCNITDGGIEVAKYGDTAYTQTGALTQAVTVAGTTYPIGTAVQTMVRQPRFYYKVVPLNLEKNESQDVISLRVTSGATAAGTITITLNGTAYEVPILATDNATYLVAEKIGDVTFAGWTVTSSTPSQLWFTCRLPGATSGLTVNAGTTGVSTTVTQTRYGYVGKGFKSRKMQYYISPTKKDGFKLHPAFIKNGIEKNYIYLSAFEGALFDVSAGAYILDDAQVADFKMDKLASISGAKPISGKTQKLTRTNCRALASNRGAGWSLQTISVLACSQLLYLIEYADLDSQGAIGEGITSGSNTGNNDAEPTGSTSAVKYRGEENIWGNIEKMLDGANVYCDVDKGIQELFIADNGFAEGVQSTTYINADITMTSDYGYISAMAYSQKSDWLFAPAETVSSHDASSVKDRYYPREKNDDYVPLESAKGYKVPLSGGSWFAHDNAGIFALTTVKDEAYRSNSLNGRLIYIPTDTAGLMPAGTDAVKASSSLPASPLEGEVICLTQDGKVPVDKCTVHTESHLRLSSELFLEDAPYYYFNINTSCTPILDDTITTEYALGIPFFFDAVESNDMAVVFYGVIPEVTDKCTLLYMKSLPATYHATHGGTLKLFYAAEGTVIEGVTTIPSTGWYRGIDPETEGNPTIIQPISEVPAELLNLAKVHGCYLHDAYYVMGEEAREGVTPLSDEILMDLSGCLEVWVNNGLYQFKSGIWKDLTYKPYMLLMAKEG